MPFIIATKNDKKVHNHVPTSFTKVKTPENVAEFETLIKNKYAAKLDVNVSELSFFWVAENYEPNSDGYRIMQGDEYTVIWTNDEVSGVDFSAEDTKGWVSFSTNKNEINGDGVDGAEISLAVYNSDKITIKTNLNVTKLVPIKTPHGIISAKMIITNGVGLLTFKKINDLPLGNYSFPARNKYLWGFRTLEYAEIDVYLEM